MEQLIAAFEALWVKIVAFFPNLLAAVIIFVLALIVTKLTEGPIAAMLRRSKIDIDEVAIKYVNRVVKILIWFIAVIMIMDKLGIPVGSLLTMLAAIGAAVALAIKDNLSNLASGVVLLFTKPFKAGDYIEVEGASGSIKEIEIMHTYLDTPGHTLVAIPNTKMMTATIVNYSTYETRRQDLLFSIGYDDDLLRAKAVLQELAEAHPLVLKDPAPASWSTSRGNRRSCSCCASGAKTPTIGICVLTCLKKVKLAFDRKGITIPYNQLDVHLPAPAHPEAGK